MPFTYVVNVYSDMSLSKGHLGSRGAPRPKMPFTYVVNVYSDMSLSKGHLGSRGAKHLKIN